MDLIGRTFLFRQKITSLGSGRRSGDDRGRPGETTVRGKTRPACDCPLLPVLASY
jgi:hypothetical protein